MRIFSQQKFINFLLLVSLVALAGSAFFAYQQVQKLLLANDWVIHTHRVIEESNHILFTLTKAESQTNRYVITQDKAELPGLTDSFNAITGMVQTIQNLTIDNYIQQLNVHTLKSLVNQQISLLKNAVETRNDTKNQPTAHKLNQEIVDMITKINQREDELLQERNALSRAEAKRSNMAVLMSGGLGCVFLLCSFFLLNHNVRARYRAERMRRQLEGRLKRIIESTDDLIAALDLDFNLIAYNTAYGKFFEHYFGKKIKVGLNMKALLSNSDKDTRKKEKLKVWERALKGEEFTIVNEYGGPNETVHYYEATYNTLRDIDNKRIGAAHIMRDITERKRVETLKSEFVSVVSHELRTPLTAIRGSLGIILGAMNKNADEKMSHMLNIAYNNCERLVSLINDILDIDKIESGKLDFKYEIRNLNKIAEDAVVGNQAYADKFNVTIQLVPSKDPLPVRVDYNRLMQVLANLISNAVKFSLPKGGVQVILSRFANVAKVAVIDHGQGIPFEFQKHIFEKFSQAESSATRKHGGSGLGLSISKAIIENLNGRISFESNEKTGTVFYFELPLWEEHYTTKGEESAPSIKSEIMQLTSNQCKRILYVEDDNDLANVVMSLMDNEADVLNVGTKAEAMKELDKHRFDLILLDLHLPDGYGSDLIPEFNKRNLPVVVFTAYELPVKYANHVKNILIKSKTSNEELLETIRNAMQMKPA